MERHSIEAIVSALNATGARYLIVGGLAVVAHGWVRLTADLDIVLDLEDPRLAAAIDGLESLGYTPRAPVNLRDFLDPAQRDAWIRDKGLTVFSLNSPRHAATEVDLFVAPPFDFEAVHSRGVRMEVGAGVMARFIGLRDLLAMKRAAGRPQDLLDVEKLNALNGPGDG